MTPKAMGRDEIGLRDTGVEALFPSPSVGGPHQRWSCWGGAVRSRGLEPKLPWAESAMGPWRPDGAQSQAATTA